MNKKILFPYLLSTLLLFWPLGHGPILGLQVICLSLSYFLFHRIESSSLKAIKHVANLFCIQFLGSALIYEALNLTALLGPLFWLVFGFIQLLLYTKEDLTNPLHRKISLLILLSFTIQALCFPPLPLGILAIIALVPWFWALYKLPTNTGLRLTFWAAIPGQLILFYWIINVVQAGYILAIGGGLFLLLAWLASFQVLLAWAFYQLKQRQLLWIWPLFATGLEIFRAWGDISFPWTPIAACLGSQMEMIQITSWIGASGLSYLIFLCNLMVFWGLLRQQKLYLVSPLILLGGLYLGGAFILQTSPVSHKNLNILLIQPNQNQKLKWDPEYFTTLMENMWHLSIKSNLQHVDLIVYPETSIPNFITRADHWPYLYDSLSKAIQTPLFMGILDYEYDESQPHSAFVYNKGFLMNPQASDWTSYTKVKLVPFSEALPFGRVFPMINFVDLGEGDFSSGAGPTIYTTKNVQWSPNICYEIIYPEYVRKQIQLGSELMVEITNDGWFGKSIQLGQHLNLVRLRAVENGIPVVRSTNTGITTALDAQGRILAQLPTHQEAVLRVNIPIQSKPSFYSSIGSWIERLFAGGFLSLLLVFFLYPAIKKQLIKR